MFMGMLSLLYCYPPLMFVRKDKKEKLSKKKEVKVQWMNKTTATTTTTVQQQHANASSAMQRFSSVR